MFPGGVLTVNIDRMLVHVLLSSTEYLIISDTIYSLNNFVFNLNVYKYIFLNLIYTVMM